MCSDALVVNFGNFHEKEREFEKIILQKPMTAQEDAKDSDTDSMLSASTPMKKKKMALSIKMSNLSVSRPFYEFNEGSRDPPTSTPAVANVQPTPGLPKPDLASATKKSAIKPPWSAIPNDFAHNHSQGGSSESNFGFVAKSPSRYIFY